MQEARHPALKRFAVMAEERDTKGGDAGSAVEALDVHAVGGRYGFRYSHLMWVRLYSPKCFTVHFSTHTVTVHGDGLVPLFSDVLQQRLRVLRASEVTGSAVADPAGPWVKSVYAVQRSGAAIEPESADEPVAPGVVEPKAGTNASTNGEGDGGIDPRRL